MIAERMHRGPAVALVALLAMTAALPAAELGRLFLTPSERAALDRARQQLGEPVVEAPVVVESLPLDGGGEVVPGDLESIRVDGFVRRTGGPATVWINGTDSYQGDLGEFGIDARELGVGASQVRVPVAGTGKSVTLKPGQSWDPGADTVSDSYEGGNTR